MDIKTLRQFWEKDIDLHDGIGHDFKHWISNDKGYLVDEITSQTELKLYLNKEDTFTKMCCAAIETIHNITCSSTFPKSWSWAAIQLYYAAFFSAHALSRIFGVCCSQLEGGHLRHIKDLANTISLPGAGSLKVSRGFYLASMNSSSNIISIKRMDNTHGDTWKCLHDTLERISLELLQLSNSSKNQTAALALSDLALSLRNNKTSGNGTWLSDFRNNLNYKHTYGGRYPYNDNNNTLPDLINMIDGWRNNSINISNCKLEKNDVRRFFYTSISVVQLCLQVLDDIQNLSNIKNSQYNRTIRSFINKENGAFTL